MNDIQLKILRMCAKEPQWATKLAKAKLVVRLLVDQGFLTGRVADGGGQVQYRITSAGEEALRRNGPTK